ncbi:phytase [Acrasis kona]|uniref:Phytase n=1 Tax=Acrasis kona TaxID=1008807 RepID=A0AAW2YSI1_9EUKA
MKNRKLTKSDTSVLSTAPRRTLLSYKNKRMRFGIIAIIVISVVFVLHYIIRFDKESIPAHQNVKVIPEVYITEGNRFDNIDSVVALQIENNHRIIATAKKTGSLFIYDLENGRLISQITETGTIMSRPNGIASFPDKNIIVIVERDGHKCQLISYPDFRSIATFGQSDLKRPYGAAVRKIRDNVYHIYVTDNYMDLEYSEKHKEMKYKKLPPDSQLGQRVKLYEVTTLEGNYNIKLIHQFGETTGEGVLHVVESIMVDEPNNRLLIADEHTNHLDVKIYDLNTHQFGGHIIGKEPIKFESDPEGFVTFNCPNYESKGWYFLTDQLSTLTKFHIIDRSTLHYVGTFTGETTKKTDGVAISQVPLKDYKQGLFLAVHDDSKVSAFSNQHILDVMGLKC